MRCILFEKSVNAAREINGCDEFVIFRGIFCRHIRKAYSGLHEFSERHLEDFLHFRIKSLRSRHSYNSDAKGPGLNVFSLIQVNGT